MNEPTLNMKKTNGEQPPDSRKRYQRPAIIHEQTLEARAGSPVPGSVDIIDLNSPE